MRFGTPSVYTVTGRTQQNQRATKNDGKSDREIWTSGDGHGDPDQELIKRSLSRKLGHPNWKIFCGNVGEIIRGQNEPPYRVYLDDKAAYDIYNSDAYTADDRVNFWPFDFAGRTGFIRTNRPNRGRPAYLLDGKTVACKKKGAGWYFFCGETGDNETLANNMSSQSNKDALAASVTASYSPQQNESPNRLYALSTQATEDASSYFGPEFGNTPDQMEHLMGSSARAQQIQQSYHSEFPSDMPFEGVPDSESAHDRNIGKVFNEGVEFDEQGNHSAPSEAPQGQVVTLRDYEHAFLSPIKNPAAVAEFKSKSSSLSHTQHESNRDGHLLGYNADEGAVVELSNNNGKRFRMNEGYRAGSISSTTSDDTQRPQTKRSRVAINSTHNSHSNDTMEDAEIHNQAVGDVADEENEHFDADESHHKVMKLTKELAAHRTGASKLRELLQNERQGIAERNAELHQSNLQMGKLKREKMASDSLVESLKTQLDDMAKELSQLKESSKKLERENEYYKTSATSTANPRTTRRIDDPLTFNESFKALQTERDSLKKERDAFRSVTLSLYQNISDQEAKFANLHTQMREMHLYFEDQTEISQTRSDACKKGMDLTKKAHAGMDSILARQRQWMDEAGLEEEWSTLVQDAILT